MVFAFGNVDKLVWFATYWDEFIFQILVGLAKKIELLQTNKNN